MKNIALLFIFIVSYLNAQSQPVSSLNENFNTTCPAGNYAPTDLYPNGPWIEYNPISPVSGLQWNCTLTGGRNSTGGIECTGYYNSIYDIDTAYLVTPQLNLNSTTYPGNVYLQFDTKTSIFYPSSLSMIRAFDDSAKNNSTDSVIYPTVFFGYADTSSDWVTHQVDLTSFKGYYFYVAFRYTSTNTEGSIWYLDNILLTATPLDVSNVNREKTYLPLAVLGYSSSESICLSYNAKENGQYDLTVYDMMGREVYKQTILAQTGPATYTINGLNLHSGMYFIKMGNGHFYGTAKTIVQ